MSEFDGIEGVEGWSAKLESMLAEAKEIAQKDKLNDRLKMSERLTAFILESRPNTKEILELDKIAEKTATGLLMETIEKRLAEITSRTAEYQRLTKQFKAMAEENQAAADSIRLKNIIRTVDSATDTINEARKLKESLKDNAEEKDVAKLIDETIIAIEKFRSVVGKML